MVNDTKWFVYMLECADGTFYTGITTNIDRRVLEHNQSDKGAKYTKTRRPVAITYTNEYPTRSDALKEEFRIKSLTRIEKEKLLKR